MKNAILALGILIYSIAGAQVPASTIHHLREWYINDFSWIKHDRLLLVRIDSEHGPSGSSLFCEANDSGSRILLSNSMAAVSKLVSDQNVKLSADFIREDLSQLLLMAFSQNGGMIFDKEYINRYEKNIRFQDDESLRHARELESVVNCEVNDGNWSLSFSVVKLDGSVDRWTSSGSISPFAIRKLTVSQIAERSYVKPLLVM